MVEDIRSVPWLSQARFEGQVYMVDVRLPLPSRTLVLNFVSLRELDVPAPVYAPATTENAVRVAHPVDILASKLGALSSRKLRRDFFDVACAHIEVYVGDPGTREHSRLEMAKTLLNYPFEGGIRNDGQRRRSQLRGRTAYLHWGTYIRGGYCVNFCPRALPVGHREQSQGIYGVFLNDPLAIVKHMALNSDSGWLGIQAPKHKPDSGRSRAVGQAGISRARVE